MNLHQQQVTGPVLFMWYIMNSALFFFLSTTVTGHAGFPDSIYFRSLWLKYYEVFTMDENTKVDPFPLTDVSPSSYSLLLT